MWKEIKFLVCLCICICYLIRQQSSVLPDHKIVWQLLIFNFAQSPYTNDTRGDLQRTFIMRLITGFCNNCYDSEEEKKKKTEKKKKRFTKLKKLPYLDYRWNWANRPWINSTCSKTWKSKSLNLISCKSHDLRENRVTCWTFTHCETDTLSMLPDEQLHQIYL